MRLARFARVRLLYHALPISLLILRKKPTVLQSKEPYPSTEREIKFRRCSFTSSIKREIRYFHVVVVQKRAKKCTKSVVHVQSCSFAYKTDFLFDVLVAVRVVGS